MYVKVGHLPTPLWVQASSPVQRLRAWHLPCAGTGYDRLDRWSQPDAQPVRLCVSLGGGAAVGDDRARGTVHCAARAGGASGGGDGGGDGDGVCAHARRRVGGGRAGGRRAE
eukprot:6186528-Pleurochrysis_carterae.AAC.1